jgi:hypothetical protein
MSDTSAAAEIEAAAVTPEETTETEVMESEAAVSVDGEGEAGGADR